MSKINTDTHKQLATKMCKKCGRPIINEINGMLICMDCHKASILNSARRCASMTNGEKITEVLFDFDFEYMGDTILGQRFTPYCKVQFNRKWWNAEYKKLATKNNLAAEVPDKIKAEITTLQNRCYALTKGTMCAFCRYECEYKVESEE